MLYGQPEASFANHFLGTANFFPAAPLRNLEEKGAKFTCDGVGLVNAN